MVLLLLALAPGCADESPPVAARAAAVTGATVITFDDLPENTLVRNQYLDKGVYFNSGHISCESDLTFPCTGNQVLRSARPSTEQDIEPLHVSFTGPQARVKFFGGFDGAGEQRVLRVYDASGALIGQDGPRVVGPGFTTPFEVSLPTARIMSFEFDAIVVTGGRKLLDNLEFEGPPPVLPTTPPRVRIVAPVDRAELTDEIVHVEGTVTGEQVVSAVLTYTRRLPGNDQHESFDYPLVLTGTGNSRTFSQDVEVGVGAAWFKVTATNAANLSSAPVSLVMVLPPPIRARIAAETPPGGEWPYGGFVVGSLGRGHAVCEYAAYQFTAVTKREDPYAHPPLPLEVHMIGPHLYKSWTQIVLPTTREPRLGCATSEETVVQTDSAGTPTAWAQDFGASRLYYSAATRAHWVSRRFAKTIDDLGGVAMIGLPVEDPRSDSDANYGDTYEFQRFRRPDGLESTLEVRGDPMRLWVERRGGDGTGYPDGVGEHSATQYQSFLCSGADEYGRSDGAHRPCPVVVPAPQSRIPLADEEHLCHDTKFGWMEFVEIVATGESLVPEWTPLVGQYVETPFYGVVTESKRSSNDAPVTHEHREECASWKAMLIAGAICLHEPACWSPLVLEEFTRYEVSSSFCPSDQDMFAHPLPGYEGLLAEQQEDFELEIERHFLDAHAPNDFIPAAGDLLFAAGRWIVDCAHPPFHTEIHPPAVLAAMKTVLAPENGLNKLHTLANVWVNGFYTGEPVVLDVYPPPRPAPTARLRAIMPIGGNLDMQYRTDIVDGNHARITITGNARHPHVTSAGEMKWDESSPAPRFAGQWRLYWIVE
jgi:hypothetical protein